MHAWIRRALCAAGLTGGIVLLGIGLAEASSADDTSGPHTTGESGILSGNQTAVDAQAPINLSGNQITVIGQRNHTSSTGTASTGSAQGPSGSSSGSPTTSGAHGIGSGNQTAVDAQAPINVSGNQVTVIGQDNDASSTGSATTGTGTAGGAAPTTTGAHGLLSGNQTAVGLQAPINAGGNQVTVIGQDNQATTTSAASTSGSGSAGPATTSGAGGLLAGNQTAVGLTLPVNVSGNQVTVIGQDNTNTPTGTTSAGTRGGSALGGATTSGQDGLLSGNQTGVIVTAPIALTGNQVTAIAQDNANTSTGGASTSGGSGEQSSTGPTTTGAGGVGSGNQTPISVQVPVDASGNQVTVVGQDNTNTSSGGSTSGGGTTSPPGTIPGGGTTSPPGGGVSPPTGGSAAPEPGASVLPETGAASGLGGVALLGLLLVVAGAMTLRRRGTSV
jgi:hypothetical protein